MFMTCKLVTTSHINYYSDKFRSEVQVATGAQQHIQIINKFKLKIQCNGKPDLSSHLACSLEFKTTTGIQPNCKQDLR